MKKEDKNKEKFTAVSGKVEYPAYMAYEQIEVLKKEKEEWIHKYHEADKERDILKSKTRSSTWWTIVFDLLLFMSAGLIFAGSSNVQNFQINTFTILGILFLIIAIIGSIVNTRYGK